MSGTKARSLFTTNLGKTMQFICVRKAKVLSLNLEKK